MKKIIPFTVVHEDERLVVVNKASGIAVTAERWDPSAGRLDRLVASVLGSGTPGPGPAETEGTMGTGPRLWTVHRIDRDTSGLVVFAKDEETHRSLSRAFEGRLVEKRYLAVVHGRPLWEETRCDLPLVPNGNKKHLTIIDRYRGKPSRTLFRFLGGVGGCSVVEALPETGRTHQIRVHLASLGHPVVCDSLYGSGKAVFLSSFKPGRRGDPFEERPLLGRLGLHAAELVLPAPAGPGGGPLRLRAPLPRDMAALIRQMEKQGAGEGLRELSAPGGA